MSYNAVLTDKNDEQVLPITTAENVFYNSNKTIKEVVDDIIAGKTTAGERTNVFTDALGLTVSVTATEVNS